MYPERMEVSPPIMKAAVVYGNLEPGGSAVNTNKMAKAKRNPHKNKYSCLRKVIAPY